VPSPNTVTVTAVSQADTTKSGSALFTTRLVDFPADVSQATKSARATVTVASLITVSISPTSATVPINGAQQFSATVQNTNNTAVNWQVNGVAGGNATVGTISTTGLYAAPSSVPSPSTVTITAVSQADATKSASATVTVAPPSTPRFAYVANSADNTVSIYTVDAMSGQLRPNGYALVGGSTPFSVTVAPSGKFAYVANSNSNNVSAFTIDATTGVLSPVASSPFAAGNGPNSVVASGKIQ
jgi:hypothetical protein